MIIFKSHLHVFDQKRQFILPTQQVSSKTMIQYKKWKEIEFVIISQGFSVFLPGHWNMEAQGPRSVVYRPTVFTGVHINHSLYVSGLFQPCIVWAD